MALVFTLTCLQGQRGRERCHWQRLKPRLQVAGLLGGEGKAAGALASGSTRSFSAVASTARGQWSRCLREVAKISTGSMC